MATVMMFAGAVGSALSGAAVLPTAWAWLQGKVRKEHRYHARHARRRHD